MQRIGIVFRRGSLFNEEKQIEKETCVVLEYDGDLFDCEYGGEWRGRGGGEGQTHN
jgi:hypothetical protein